MKTSTSLSAFTLSCLVALTGAAGAFADDANGVVGKNDAAPQLAQADTSSYAVDIRIVEASGMGMPKKVDAKLGALAKDFEQLPMQNFVMRDQHTAKIKTNERISLEFPGNGKEKRFLKVLSKGKDGSGKVRLELNIDELSFNTVVVVPDNGTIIVGGPRSDGKTIVFAVTARKMPAK